MMTPRGGARPGAGRKPLPPEERKRPTVAIRLDEAIAFKVRALLEEMPPTELLFRLEMDVDALALQVREAWAIAENLEAENNRLRAKLAGVEVSPVAIAPEVMPTEETPEPMAVTLNRDQEQAISTLKDWFSSRKKMACLSGAGGTGKTFSVGYFLKELTSEDDCLNVVFVAPTHKAKNVLKKALRKSGIGGEVLTVAQSLGKQPIIDKQGDELFAQKNKTDWLEGADIVVCDEASMVGVEDFGDICYRVGSKILWMGDRYQLPPVGEFEACAFSHQDIRDKAELRQVMRYKGHILSECEKLREAVELGKIYTPRPDGESIIYLPRNEWIKKASELFKTSAFEEDSSYCRMLAYRNAVVDSSNSTLKRFVFGHNLPFFKGQKLVATRPISRLVQSRDEKGRLRKEWQILASNSEEMQVMSEVADSTLSGDDISLAPRHLQKLAGVPVSRFTCFSEGGLHIEAIVLSSEAIARKMALIKEIKSLPIRSKDDNAALKFLYALGDELKDIFCLTVHKSQGSTFNHIFVDVADILKPPSRRKIGDPDDRPRLLYTAISRASERVYITD